MAKSRTISVKFINPGPKGLAILDGKKWPVVVSADEVRRLYYAVLGIKIMDKRPLVEIVNDIGSHISVDVPEDVLRVEKACSKRK